MGMNKTPILITLTDDEQRELQRISRSWVLPHREVVRAQVILLLADGRPISAVSREAKLQRRIVRKWAEKFTRKRLDGLTDDPRSGRPARFSPCGRAAPGQARV